MYYLLPPLLTDPTINPISFSTDLCMPEISHKQCLMALITVFPSFAPIRDSQFCLVYDWASFLCANIPALSSPAV